MTQGLENDLFDVRFYFESTPVKSLRSNEPVEDINSNTIIVDNKAILARDTALTVQSDLANHIGQGGISEHAIATTSVAGFMSSAEVAKLSQIQEQAQLNILAPVDAVQLISRGVTTLHQHPPATTVTAGFVSAVDKAKLDGIDSLAEVNNISTANATTLTSGGNADTLHTHSFAPGTEGFTQAVHSFTDHEGLPGIATFPGFAASAIDEGPLQAGPGVTLHSKTYSSFTSLQVVSSGLKHIQDDGWWGLNEAFSVNSITVVGNMCIIACEVVAGGYGDMRMRTWQVGYGVV